MCQAFTFLYACHNVSLFLLLSWVSLPFSLSISMPLTKHVCVFITQVLFSVVCWFCKRFINATVIAALCVHKFWATVYLSMCFVGKSACFAKVCQLFHFSYFRFAERSVQCSFYWAWIVSWHVLNGKMASVYLL